MKKDNYSFIAIFHYAEDGISISFPDLPGCYPSADTTEEALKNAREALGLHLWSIESDGDSIPNATIVTDISLRVGEVPVLIEVFMTPIRDRINNSVIKKTLTIPRWLNAEAERHNVNFSLILQNALKDYLHLSS